MHKLAIIIFGVLLAACQKDKPAPAADGRRELSVTVNAGGYEPSEVRAPANQPVRVVFTRTSDEGCGQEVVFPRLNLRRDLPLDKPVAVDFEMPDSGRLEFTCGMNMFRGAVVVQ